MKSIPSSASILLMLGAGCGSTPELPAPPPSHPGSVHALESPAPARSKTLERIDDAAPHARPLPPADSAHGSASSGGGA